MSGTDAALPCWLDGVVRSDAGLRAAWCAASSHRTPFVDNRPKFWYEDQLQDGLWRYGCQFRHQHARKPGWCNFCDSTKASSPQLCRLQVLTSAFKRGGETNCLYFLVLQASSRVPGAWERVGVSWLGPRKPLKDIGFFDGSTVEELLLV